jgi:hypothetical protein
VGAYPINTDAGPNDLPILVDNNRQRVNVSHYMTFMPPSPIESLRHLHYQSSKQPWSAGRVMIPMDYWHTRICLDLNDTDRGWYIEDM